MARFSQQFIQSLTQPSFGQGLFQVGQAVGQIPTTTRAMQQQKKEKETLAGFDPNTVEGLAGLATFYQGQGELDKAVEYATAARTLRDQLETKQKATKKEKEKEEARARLRGFAFLKAAREKDPASAVGRVREMTLEQLMEYTQAEEIEGYTLTPGAQRYSGENVLLATAPTKPAKPTAPKVEVRLQGDDLVTLTDGKETNRIKPPEDAEKTLGARNTVATSAVQQIGFIDDAIKFLETSSDDAFTPMGDPSGFFGGVLSGVPGTDAYTLENKYYQQIRGAEARRAIEEMKKASEEYGSKGTGLGQITQIEFRTLMANISGLTTGLSVEDQIDSMERMKENYERIQKLAAGENIVDIIDFSKPEYVKSGYVKEGDTLYYYPQGPDGPERVYNRETNKFE